MAKLKKKYHTDFTTVATAMFRDRNLNLKDRGLLATMLSLPEDWDFSIKGLASIVADGESSVRRCLQRLEELGYLKRRKVTAKGVITDWEYIFSDTPMTEDEGKSPDDENPHVENQQLDNQHVEKPQLENQPQLNIQEENRKEENYNNPDFLKAACQIIGEVPSRLSKNRRKLILDWEKQGIGLDLVKMAWDEAVSTGDVAKQNVNYLNGILRQWQKQGRRVESDFHNTFDGGNLTLQDEEDVMLRDRTIIPVFEG